MIVPRYVCTLNSKPRKAIAKMLVGRKEERKAFAKHIILKLGVELTLRQVQSACFAAIWLDFAWLGF